MPDTTAPVPFDPHRWIGRSSYLIDCLLADPRGRETLERLHLLADAEVLSAERDAWSESALRIMREIAARRAVA